jgi:hypothetical protein
MEKKVKQINKNPSLTACADRMARKLVVDKVDVNEIGKIISYARAYIVGKKDNGEKLFTYLEFLVKYGNEIGHSNKTVKFYKSILDTCKTYLDFYTNEPRKMLWILGWTYRLMKYYETQGLPISNDEKKLPKPKPKPKTSPQQKQVTTSLALQRGKKPH